MSVYAQNPVTGEWQLAVPLPFQARSLFRVKLVCWHTVEKYPGVWVRCGAKFKGKARWERYVAHYRKEHLA